ncbi:MAG: hypothetical protein IT260_14205 [Saprospiraceae bacterium]|nr:hypothetical protein [Saprospiraceae bacterium]
MTLHRVVLLVPFVRHYAGSVFDLYESLEPDGWDDDDRGREKISFHQRSFRLPDNGKGAPTNLSKSDTMPCPPRLFEGLDLRTGPCRITSMQPLAGGSIDAQLSDIGAHSGQGVLLRLDAGAKAPFRITLTDTREKQDLGNFEKHENPALLDLSQLEPGFYRLTIEDRKGAGAVVQLLKCFPLVALLEEGRRNITGTMKTIY